MGAYATTLERVRFEKSARDRACEDRNVRCISTHARARLLSRRARERESARARRLGFFTTPSNGQRAPRVEGLDRCAAGRGGVGEVVVVVEAPQVVAVVVVVVAVVVPEQEAPTAARADP